MPPRDNRGLQGADGTFPRLCVEDNRGLQGANGSFLRLCVVGAPGPGTGAEQRQNALLGVENMGQREPGSREAIKTRGDGCLPEVRGLRLPGLCLDGQGAEVEGLVPVVSPRARGGDRSVGGAFRLCAEGDARGGLTTI